MHDWGCSDCALKTIKYISDVLSHVEGAQIWMFGRVKRLQLGCSDSHVKVKKQRFFFQPSIRNSLAWLSSYAIPLDFQFPSVHCLGFLSLKWISPVEFQTNQLTVGELEFDVDFLFLFLNCSVFVAEEASEAVQSVSATPLTADSFSSALLSSYWVMSSNTTKCQQLGTVLNFNGVHASGK